MGYDITIKEIAEMAGVSSSTVSKALNGSPEISIGTRLHIKRIAIKKGYKANNTARALKSKRSGSIGIIVPEISSSFFSRMVQGAASRAKERGLKSYICFSNESFKIEKKLIASFIDHSVDGLIISLSKQTQNLGSYDHIAELRKYIPIVMVDRVCDVMECDKVELDNIEASKSALRHLVSTGCRNIVFLTTIKPTSVSKNRMYGFKEECKTLKAAGGNGLKAKVVEMNGSDELEKRLGNLLQKDFIDAFIIADELATIKTHGYLQRNGYKIPQDISIIGFTNSEISKNIYPSLTMISQNAEQLGKRALDVLALRMTKSWVGPACRQIKIRHKMIIRESTKQVKVKTNT